MSAYKCLTCGLPSNSSKCADAFCGAVAVAVFSGADKPAAPPPPSQVKASSYRRPPGDYPYHGVHWWLGIGNTRDVHGKPAIFTEWHAVKTWTVRGRVYATGPCWITPRPADEMGGEWGPEIIPPPYK